VTVTSVPLVPVTRSVNVPRAVEAVVRTRSVVLPGVAIGLLDQLAVAPNPFSQPTVPSSYCRRRRSRCAPVSRPS
jgi:hypothetical protein